MPGRDFKGVLPAVPAWGLPCYREHYTFPDGRTVFTGDRVRVQGRNGLYTFIAHRDHPSEQGLDVLPDGGVRVVVSPDKVKPAKGSR